MELELRLDSMSRLFLSFQIRKNNQTLHSGDDKGMILCMDIQLPAVLRIL